MPHEKRFYLDRNSHGLIFQLLGSVGFLTSQLHTRIQITIWKRLGSLDLFTLQSAYISVMGNKCRKSYLATTCISSHVMFYVIWVSHKLPRGGRGLITPEHMTTNKHGCALLAFTVFWPGPGQILATSGHILSTKQTITCYIWSWHNSTRSWCELECFMLMSRVCNIHEWLNHFPAAWFTRKSDSSRRA